MTTIDHAQRPISSLYAEVTDRIIAELEAGSFLWVRPWDSGYAGTGLPCNAGTGRRYSGINVLILWYALSEQGYGSQRWITYKQAQDLGGHVRKGERGTTIFYVDRFTPRNSDSAQLPLGEDEEQRQVALLKRFTVFNVEQCEGLSRPLAGEPGQLLPERELIPRAEALIAATGADFRIGGGEAFYMPSQDYIRVPPQQAYREQINWYRTALHELGHWTGHRSRLGRFEQENLSGEASAREELVAEMCSAFTCAELGIVPAVRYSDYIATWLEVLKKDNRAILRAASNDSKAADYPLSFRQGAREDERQEGGHDARIRLYARRSPASEARSRRCGKPRRAVGLLRGRGVATTRAASEPSYLRSRARSSEASCHGTFIFEEGSSGQKNRRRVPRASESAHPDQRKM